MANICDKKNSNTNTWPFLLVLVGSVAAFFTPMIRSPKQENPANPEKQGNDTVTPTPEYVVTQEDMAFIENQMKLTNMIMAYEREYKQPGLSNFPEKRKDFVLATWRFLKNAEMEFLVSKDSTRIAHVEEKIHVAEDKYKQYHMLDQRNLENILRSEPYYDLKPTPFDRQFPQGAAPTIQGR